MIIDLCPVPGRIDRFHSQNDLREETPMSCTDACRRPTPAQAHCGACHVTFGGVSGFDAHRRGGQCHPPDEVGYTDDGTGVFRAPLSADGKARWADSSGAQAAEKDSGVHGYTPGPENADLAPTVQVRP